jgi:hypothetical protein
MIAIFVNFNLNYKYFKFILGARALKEIEAHNGISEAHWFYDNILIDNNIEDFLP